MSTLLVPFAPGNHSDQAAAAAIRARRAATPPNAPVAPFEPSPAEEAEYLGLVAEDAWRDDQLALWMQREEWEAQLEADRIMEERSAEIAYREACTYRVHVA